MVQCWGEAHKARPRGDSRQKGRFIQGINQLKAAGPEKVVCLAARAALSFTEARRAHILSYDRLQVAIKERKRFQEEISQRQYLLVDKCLVFWFLPSPCNTGYNLATNMGVVTYIWFLVSIWKKIFLSMRSLFLSNFTIKAIFTKVQKCWFFWQSCKLCSPLLSSTRSRSGQHNIN